MIIFEIARSKARTAGRAAGRAEGLAVSVCRIFYCRGDERGMYPSQYTAEKKYKEHS